MEKAILKTLAYYDIFNFPLKAWEVHKWLTGSTASLQQVEKKLNKMKNMGKITTKGKFWFLAEKNRSIRGREGREKISQSHLRKTRLVAKLFKLIPWIKLVGISGSLSMMASLSDDDIDLFIITSKNRIWLTRLTLIFLTSTIALRRKRREKILQASGKICINLILENDNLGQKKKNIYVAHEVLQMQVLWQRDNIYSKFLEDNSWAFKYLPNWRSGVVTRNEKRETRNEKRETSKLVDWLEEMVKRLQLKIMAGPSGSERIESGALYFHPEDKGEKIMEKYRKRISNF